MAARRRADDHGAVSELGPALESALSTVGDRWSLLVVAALLEGARRFSDLQESLPGLAPNVLTARLRHLERHGVLLARPYSQRPPRMEYRLTARGRDLAGAIRLLRAWEGTAEPGSGPPRHEACGTPMEARWFCPTCRAAVGDDDPDTVWM